MDIGVALEGAAGLLLISVPWLLLAIFALRRRRAVEVVPAESADGHPSVPKDALGMMTVPSSDDGEPMNLPADEASGAIFLAPVPEPVLTLQEQEDALVLAIEEAKTARDDLLLSRRSVALARVLIARSQRPRASSFLQSAVLAARRAKLPVVHAEARIELAELALADGDLTSACEHWQMAKLMFHETGRRHDQDRMADLMRQQRCPTDWVLTNF